MVAVPSPESRQGTLSNRGRYHATRLLGDQGAMSRLILGRVHHNLSLEEALAFRLNTALHWKIIVHQASNPTSSPRPSSVPPLRGQAYAKHASLQEVYDWDRIEVYCCQLSQSERPSPSLTSFRSS